MDTIPWILITVLILIIILAGVVVLLKKKYKTPTDYYAFFWMGIIWLIFGIPIGNYALSVMGIIFTIIGLANKNKWQANRVTWNQLSADQKKYKIIIISVLSVLVLVGMVVYFLTERGII